MDEKAINEKISAWFEPKPPDKLWDGFSHESEKRAWICPSGCHSWYALDYFTSEDANALLLEAMPFPTLYRSMAEKRWICHPVGLAGEQYPEGADDDRKTAVVLAFCKFAGLEVN